jgi:ribulose-5-phosphate 4-epimerase/fuculose-1-phosphate aldolase
VGRTVDEAAFLFASLDRACHGQLLAEAAAANGLPKKIASHKEAQYTADAVQNPVFSILLYSLPQYILTPCLA